MKKFKTFSIFVIFFGLLSSKAIGDSDKKTIVSFPQNGDYYSFCADVKDNFYVLDITRRQVSIYDSDGKKINSFQVPIPLVDEFIVADDLGNFLCFSRDENSSFFGFDKNGHFLKLFEGRRENKAQNVVCLKNIFYYQDTGQAIGTFSDSAVTTMSPNFKEAEDKHGRLYEVLRDLNGQPDFPKELSQLRWSFSNCLYVDVDGDIYADCAGYDPACEIRCDPQQTKTFKFNGDLKILGVMDSGTVLNLETKEAFEMVIKDGQVNILKDMAGFF